MHCANIHINNANTSAALSAAIAPVYTTFVMKTTWKWGTSGRMAMLKKKPICEDEGNL
jgi:hypothetical protein